MAKIGTPQNPMRVAIVGSGPAGFYAAEALMKDDERAVEVDIYDRLPTPYGLVRAGVAPDHPKIKSVIRVYEKTAARPGFRFFGNVEVGADVSVSDLRERYNAILLAYGTSVDKQLGIPGEELPGSYSATEFVNWYNAHPDFAGRSYDLSCERVVVIGNGNVAADVARMLALPREELEETDTADHAIEAFANSEVEEIVVLGRRGPAQAAFTNPEVRELGEMTQADVIVSPAEMELDAISRAYLESDDCDPTNRRNVEIFEEFSRRTPEGKKQRIVLRFLCSPLEIRGDGRVEKIVVGRNELVESGGRVSARDTGEREEIECGLVLRSIGYRGVSLEGLPFDEGPGLIPNEGGRVSDPESGEPIPGLYVNGWIKRGPSGVIGTNKKDAQETVGKLLSDLDAGDIPEASAEHDGAAIAAWLGERVPDHVSFEQWRKIDAAEVAAGEPLGRPRVKFRSIEEMVEAARGDRAAA